MLFRCLAIYILIFTVLGLFLHTDLCADTHFSKTDILERTNETKSITIPKDSVLQLIPKNTLALVYCPSLKTLNNNISLMINELLSQEGTETEQLARILAYAIGLDFERLDALEELGLDLDRDLAVFFTSLNPVHISAVLHLKDPETMKELITSEAEGIPSNSYKEATYWNTTDGMKNIAILEDFLLFSQQIDVCRNMIDIRNGSIESKNPNQGYGIFLTDISNHPNEISYFYDSKGIKTSPNASLMNDLESIRDNFNGQNDQVIEQIYDSLFRSMGTNLNEKFQSISGSIQIEKTDIILNQFIQLENGSKYFETDGIIMLGKRYYSQLPDTSILNGSIQGSPELIGMLSKLLLYNFPKDTSEYSDKLGYFQQQLQHFHRTMVTGVQGSVSLEESLLPDYLFIYDLKDQEKAKTFMNVDFKEAIFGVYGSQKGKPIIHNGVEIHSYIFPDLIPAIAEKEPNQSKVLPHEWNWYYAFNSGRMYLSITSEPEILKLALDRDTMTDIEIQRNESKQKLIDHLGADNNILLFFSPITAVKNTMPLLAKMDMPGAASMHAYSVMFETLPDNYSIGFSAKAEGEGINTKLMITLGDFKPLFQFLGMMFSPDNLK